MGEPAATALSGPPAAPPPPAAGPIVVAPPSTPAAPKRYDAKTPASSPAMHAYFDRLNGEAMRLYAIAKQARRKGKDPSLEVEIPPAEDLAARVEAQVGPVGIASRIREATERLGNREVVSLQVARDVAQDVFKSGQSKEKALDQAVRTGLSILTEGVLVAPLEGIAEVKVGRNADGSDYVDMYFAGPIRAAGGTAQAMSLLIGDLVRRELGIGHYIATDSEVERYKEEIPAYKRVANLQYTPTGPEIELIVRNCPVCINGEGTEREEVTGNRDLPRVETNRIRSGACLVLAEGLVLKAPKVLKHVQALKLEGWSFLKEFEKKGAKGDAALAGKDGIPEIRPSDKYAADVIAGRPMFAHPSRPGGFRLRYGRSRTAGLASTSIHPATMALLDEFLAIGTQMKVERPGKGTLATPCDELEGPTALLHSGHLVRITSMAQARELRPAVKEIVDIGEILVPFGEFAENNQNLPHASWCWEWWVQEHQKATGEAADVHKQGTIDGEAMVRLAETTGVPLHPDGTLLWHDLTLLEIRALGEWVKAKGVWEDGTLWLQDVDPAGKELLVRLLCMHELRGGLLRIEPRLAYPLLRCLGLERGAEVPQVEDTGAAAPAGPVLAVADTPRRAVLYDPCQPDPSGRYPTVEVVARLAGFLVRPKAPCRIGGRMGRPEKADSRRMKPPPHGIFPIAKAGEAQRLVRKAAEQGEVEVEVGERQCTSCGRRHWRTFCDCGAHTEAVVRKGLAAEQQKGKDRPKTLVDVRAEMERARNALRLDRLPETIKAVEGLVSKLKTPEPLEKALLRARNDVYTFKDGTVRFDMTDIPVTHFRPREVGLTVEKAVELGYTHDCRGAALVDAGQMLEIRVQDLIVADACGDYLLKATKYLDELLERFYGLAPFYKCEKRKDLIGHLTIGLAPHTSGGVLSRIVGFTKAQAHFCHPYFHAAKRRNCLVPETQVFVLNSPALVRTDMRSLFESGRDEHGIDDAGTVARVLDGVRVLAADPATGAVKPRRALRALRVVAPRHLLRFTTRHGRTWTCSPEHRIEVVRGGRLHKLKALEVEPGESVPAVGRVATQAVTPGIDLLALWGDRDDLTVRPPAGFLDGVVKRLGGRKQAADAMGLATRQLDNFLQRESIPWSLLRRVCKAADLPDPTRLGRPRDRATVPARIVPDAAFMRLVGYYLAEGCARTGAVHHVDIACTEADIVQDVVACAARLLGHPPRPQPTRVTLSGRLVHDLFVDVLGAGSGAHSKRMPAFLAGTPPPLMAELLKAYFAGDGSVETGRAHVTCHSVSRGLLQDISVQLARQGIASRFSTSVRRGGGAVAAHARRSGADETRTFTSHRLSVRSTHARRFAQRVGFASGRKQAALAAALAGVRSSRMQTLGDLVIDEVSGVEVIGSTTPYLYDLEVEGFHNFVLGDLALTSNCDGDEDAVLLLLDGLLNFSRAYIPESRGGLMDLPLVLTTRLDPNEIDKEAHNVDTLWRYPLSFYEATTRHAHPSEVAKAMGMAGARIGLPSQYEGFGYTHDTRDMSEGPAQSVYKTLGSMKDKMTAQMDLARKTRAVDEADLGAKVIGTHLLPDIMGNLKSFSKQAVRCPKCNKKYRRMPLKGSCLSCGNANLTLTVHEGSVRKYLNVSKEIAEKYDLDPYTRQRIALLESAVESVFTNDKVRKAKLSDFFGP